jgi:hypothetical protein
VGYEPEDVPAVQPMEFEQDALHANNPQYCVDYVHEIFEHLIATENKLMPSSAYMDTVLSVPPNHFPPTLPRPHEHEMQHLLNFHTFGAGIPPHVLDFPRPTYFKFPGKRPHCAPVTLPAWTGGWSVSAVWEGKTVVGSYIGGGRLHCNDTGVMSRCKTTLIL